MRNKILSIVSIACSSIMVNAVTAQTMQGPLAGPVGSTSPSSATAPGAASSSLSAISSSNIFDGSTNINIPIHSFSLDNMNFGISLGFNTRGIKVDEPANPVSIHWNLYAEGSIVRIQKDLPDELNKTSTDTVPVSGPWLDTVLPNHYKYLKGKMVTHTETASQQSAPNVYRDAEYDDFIFSCGGRSFTFNLGPEGQVFSHPHNNIKVRPMIDGVPVFLVPGQSVGDWACTQNQGILGFLITDEQGTRYLFERGDYQSSPLYVNEYNWTEPIGSAYVTSRWVIKKIIFANGNELKYTYENTLNSWGSKYYQQYYANEEWSGGTTTLAKFLGTQTSTGSMYSTQIKGIQYPNGNQADFIYSATDTTEIRQKMLDEIRITSGTQCMRYKLNRSSVNKRWFLNSVTLLSCDSTVTEPYYSFEYNPLALPPRLNSAQDYYGYYNGDSTGISLGTLGGPSSGPSSGNSISIPQHNTAFLYGNTRDANPAFAVAGNLMKVKNAFGGEVSFRYSGNVGTNPFQGSAVTLPGASNYFMATGALDGLRVDSIIEKEKFHPSDSSITVYEYSGGQIFMPGGYFHYPEFVDDQSVWEKVIFQSMFLTAHQFLGGSNHGYSVVTEKSYTGSGQLLGKTETTFSNMKDVYSNNQLNYYKTGKDYFEYPYTDKQYLKDWAIGLPMKVVSYDQNNRIVRETEHVYNIIQDNSASAFISNVKKVNVRTGYYASVPGWPAGISPPYPNRKVFTDTYSPFTGLALRSKTKTKSYVSDTRFVADSVLYTYDSRNNLKTTTTLNSKGEQVKTVLVYNYDVSGPGVAGGGIAGTTLYNMTDAGLEKNVSMERWKQDASGTVTGQRLLSSYINTFTYQGGVLRAKSVYDLKNAAPLTYATYTAGIPTNPYSKILQAFEGVTVPTDMEKSTEVKLSDAKGNPLETQINNMNLYKSMIWDTVRGKKLAEVASAQYADIAFSGFEASVKGNFQYNALFIVPSSNLPVGGISGDKALRAENTTAPLTHPGLTAGKEYILSFWCTIAPSFSGGGLGNIPVTNVYSPGNGWSLYTAKFTPINNSPLGFTTLGFPSLPFSYYLDDVRIYPATATMQTYNYTPLFGISSAADANGRITYYEYDKLGRQTIVRDQQGNIISKTKTYNGGGL